MDVLTVALLGYETQQLSTVVGGVAGVVSTVVVLLVLGLALAPVASEEWAEQLGVAERAPGPDPAEVLEGTATSPAGADGDAELPDEPASEDAAAEQSAGAPEPAE